VGDEVDDRQELLAAIRELTDAMQQGAAGDAGAVPLALLRVALQRQLDDPAHGGVPGGGVTFSAMGSLRGLPYPVVCVIGLDDGVFPSAQRPPEFDLMPLQPRRGDRQRRSDERNLFLDLLLAARHSLYLSHTGRSVRDNAPLPPSVLVSELLDLLIPAIAEDPGSPAHLAQARRRLVVEHPLPAFGGVGCARAGPPRLRSHHRELGDALRQSLQAPKTLPTPPAPIPEDDDDEDDADAPSGAEPAFFVAALPTPGPEWHELRLEQLVEFFRNPCRYLLRRRLGLELVRAADELQDDEPFLPDGPARRALAERLLPPLLAGADAAAVQRLAHAGRELPPGALGRHALEHELAELTAFAQRVAAHRAAPCLPPHPLQLSFDLDGERWQLLGGLADLRADGLLRWRCDALRPADRLEAWITHLALCAAPPPGVQAQTRWLSLDTSLLLQAPAQPGALLLELLRLYRRGLCEPLPFFPKSAWAFVDEDGSMAAAARAWTPTRDRPFAEGADPAYRLALRGLGDPLAGDFADLAQRVYGPLIDASADPGA
jgi:exodeoxyribonuclease V gamma subunit